MHAVSRSYWYAAPAAIALAAGLASPALAQTSMVDKSWTCGTGNWSSAGCWTPVGVPGLFDVVRIGNVAGVHNQTVRLDLDDRAGAMHITDGMTFDTNDFTFWLTGPTTVSGRNEVGPQTYRSTLRVGFAGKTLDYDTTSLTITDGARVDMVRGFLRAGDISIADGAAISGDGMIQLMDAGSNFVNNGTLYPGLYSGLLFSQAAGGTYDLDGTSGDGRLDLNVQGGVNLSLLNGGLSDPFSGVLVLSGDSWFFTNFAAGWTADASSSIYTVCGPGSGPARIRGAALTFGGLITVTGADGHLQFECPVTLANTAIASLDPAKRLETTSSAVILGGEYHLPIDAVIDFQGATEVRGGSFSTISTSPGDGSVNFNGPTEWRGTVNFAGVARQHGEATVTAPTVINADIFDMDGTSPHPWNIQSTFTVNAEELDINGSIVDGELNVNGAGLFTVNLDHPAANWAVADEMNLSGMGGAPHLLMTRVAGSRMRVQGALNVTGGRPRITADATFPNSAVVSIPGAADELNLAGETLVAPFATFQGAGTLGVGLTGDLTLEDGADTDAVGVFNRGLLRIGSEAGEATVDRFQNSAEGRLVVSLGGTAPGSEHDVLHVSGAATLAGRIAVELLDLSGGLYEPPIGAEFTVLTAAGGIAGAFAADAVASAGGRTWQFSVEHGPSEVVLRLESTGNCSADCDISTGAGVLDIFDFLCFQNLFAALDPYACNFDTGTGTDTCDIFDFLAFQNAFAVGCP